ncbi:MAG: type II toxin-antitoxin system PemK/MazF family toxin [Pseudonocardiaceae bacterium]
MQRVSPHAQLAPWQVWWVDFGSPIEPEQGGIRPAIVVGSTTHCRFPIDMALMVPLTARDRQLDHHVRIASPESGLSRPSWARTEDITTVSTRRLTQAKRTVSAAEAKELSIWLRAMVAFFG